MVKKFIIIFMLAIAVLGCSYSVYTSEYPHLKSIHVFPFDNKTTEYSLSQDAQNTLVNKFISDGRLKINTQNPDCTLKGSIIDYQKKIFSYDNSGNIKEYQIQILFSVEFYDTKYSKAIYENKTLYLSRTYSTNTTNTNIATSESEAIEKIFTDLFDNIIKNTLESW